ncbi:phage tail tube protein [Micromonospora wenchangensis]|uniref:phage tail tube protein n=1 Tax=Micromonospora wenchangensis TaxID=1185415 RepID=UPI003807CCD0
MPAAVAPKNALSFGAGWLYWAPLGTSVPACTVSGSVFTDTWPVGWVLLGVTREGHEFNYELSTEDVEAAEYLDPIATVTTGRTAGMSFEMMQIHATNLKRALNGGTIATSGSGATLRSELTPPAMGQETRCMLGWESQDLTERLYAEQAFQTGSLSIARRKGADNAGLPTEWRFEPAADGNPYHHIFAGAVRG